MQCIIRLVKCDHNITHYFGNNERTDNFNLLSFGVSYNFVALSNLSQKKKKKKWDITWKELGFKTMFKS